MEDNLQIQNVVSESVDTVVIELVKKLKDKVFSNTPSSQSALRSDVKDLYEYVTGEELSVTENSIDQIALANNFPAVAQYQKEQSGNTVNIAENTVQNPGVIGVDTLTESALGKGKKEGKTMTKL